VFEAKKNDLSNYNQTVAFQEEVSRRQQEQAHELHSARASLGNELNQQSTEKASYHQQIAHEDRVGDVQSTGIEFECYTRDPMIRQEKNTTSEFQRGQIDAEHFKRQEQRERDVSPDKTTLSDLQLS